MHKICDVSDFFLISSFFQAEEDLEDLRSLVEKTDSILVWSRAFENGCWECDTYYV